MRAAQILAHERRCGGLTIDKHRVLCTAAERLDAELTRSGKQIKHLAANFVLNHIEQRFLHAVGGRAREHAVGRFEVRAACGSGNDSHIL